MLKKSSYNSWWYKYLLAPIMICIGKIKWNGLRALFNHGIYYDLKERDHDVIRSLLRKNYCVILTHRKTHLTTYGIGLLNLLLTGKVGYWRHCLSNVEGENPLTDEDYELIEATGIGTHKSSFMEVFDVDGVCILIPQRATIEEWELIMKQVKSMIGRPYDLIFNINDNSRLSCVEVLLQAAKNVQLAEKVFPTLLKLIAEDKNLTPDMFAEAAGPEGDFRIAYQVKY